MSDKFIKNGYSVIKIGNTIHCAYVRARRRTTRLVRQAKKLHERKIVKSIKKNSKGFWRLVRQKTKVNTGITDLVVDGKTVTSDIEKGEALT